MPPAASPLPRAGGIGLKPQHYRDVMRALDDRSGHAFPDHWPAPAWVEVHPQNYAAAGGPAHRWLSAVAERLPLSFHSVGLSLGSADGLNEAELGRLAALTHRYDPAVVSDHLSWSGNAHDRYPELLPVPHTAEALDHFVAQIGRVQERLGRAILIENPSRTLSYRDDEMDEPEFLNTLCRRAGCGLLFDVNNVEVAAMNTGFDAGDYVDRIDAALVVEMHLAGHAREDHDSGPLLIDDHGSRVTDTTWTLYARFVERAGPRPTLIEWDTDVPEYAVLMDEVAKLDAALALHAR